MTIEPPAVLHNIGNIKALATKDPTHVGHTKEDPNVASKCLHKRYSSKQNPNHILISFHLCSKKILSYDNDIVQP